MAYNYKIGQLKPNAMYRVSLIDKWDGSTETKEMDGTTLVSFTNAAAHLYDIHAEEIKEDKTMSKKPVSRINSDLSIKKAVNNWRGYMDMHTGDAVRIHISAGNNKLGAIMNVSLPPVVTCHNCSSCKHYCYAVRTYNRFTDTAMGWNENYILFLTDPEKYFSDISNAVKTQRFFRWHVSGDIVNIDYLMGMIQVAKDNPKCEFLAFTKAY